MKNNCSVKNILTFTLLFLFSGCATTKKLKHNQSSDQEQLDTSIARLTMIPDSPIGFAIQKITHDQDSSENLQVTYKKNKHFIIDIKQLANAYQIDMETLGWDCVGSFCNEQESVLLFMRPDGVWSQIFITDTGFITITVMHKS